jgi:hypothetical protein
MRTLTPSLAASLFPSRSSAILRLCVSAILGFATSAAFAADISCNEPCDPSEAWFGLNGITLTISYPGAPGYAKWSGKFDNESNDYQLESEMSDGNATRTGSMLVVGGLVMAVKGGLVKPGHEFDLLDGAALSQQMVYRLLSTALPDGPDALEGVQKVDYSSDKIDLELATMVSESAISAPWRVTGKIRRVGINAFDYDLALTSSGGAGLGGSGAYNPHLSGSLSKPGTARIDDSISLAGWETYDVGVQMIAVDGALKAANGTQSPSEPYNTVGEVRRKIADTHAADPSPDKDFTGLWKEHCEDNFGLQIVRSNEDGKYVIGFCGPGGCEDSGSARHSFIIGDSNYEVVGDNELIQTGEQGGHQLYRRCAMAEN